MLKHLRFDIFELLETKLPVRLINTTNERRLVQGHETTPLRVKWDIEDVYSEMDTTENTSAPKCFKRDGVSVVKRQGFAKIIVPKDLRVELTKTTHEKFDHPVDGTGEVVLEVRRLQKTDISSYQQKGTGAPQQVANQFLDASGKQISRKTVARRLRGGGLYARTPVVCVPLTRQHRTARLQWCREHHNWTEQDWACLHASTCGCEWDYDGQRYIDEVLLPHDRLFHGDVGDKFVFMDDNATCHRTLAVQDCLDSEGIQRLVWSARSPDLNPIENVWDALGRQVAGLNYPPTNKNTLIRALTEEWDKLPQQLLDNVVQSMVRRVECSITLHGGHMPY
ncbi:transposable element Tcb1 transposase [Trichonephila clavipes]|nr:transposable element Tcb1 transposase [Trichonephila clavipes]